MAGHPKGLVLVDLLRPLARTYRGVIGGAGVVLWPPDLKNLYYWVFGDTYDNQGVQLPPAVPTADPFYQPSRPFQRNDGMPPIGTEVIAAGG